MTEAAREVLDRLYPEIGVGVLFAAPPPRARQ
jgi:hypothetical protein